MPQSTPVDRVAVRGDELDEGVAPLERGSFGEADAVFAVGATALAGTALADPAVPLVPVGAGGAHGVASEALPEAAAALSTGDYRTVTHPVLGVDVDGERLGRAAFDATLMTSEPARISEYAVAAEGERLFDVRADGIVASAPLGSAEYGRAAGGPVVAPGGGLSVVPVAPFSTRANPWVLPGPLELTVERDEGTVALFADADELTTVTPGETVSVSVVGEFSVLRPLVGDR